MTNSSVTVGLLHPGEMGATVGATVVGGGARVLWASEGRSRATRARALEIGLEDAGTLAALIQTSRVILSVVPPHGARESERAVRRHDGQDHPARLNQRGERAVIFEPDLERAGPRRPASPLRGP